MTVRLPLTPALSRKGRGGIETQGAGFGCFIPSPLEGEGEDEGVEK